MFRASYQKSYYNILPKVGHFAKMEYFSMYGSEQSMQLEACQKRKKCAFNHQALLNGILNNNKKNLLHFTLNTEWFL